MDQGAGGLRPQVGNVIGNKTRIAPLVLAKHGANGRGHDLDVGHHHHHVARRDLGLGVKPQQKLVMQHLEFTYRAVRHFENQRVIVRVQRGLDRLLARLQIADAVLQLREQTAAVGPRRIVKQVQANTRMALLRRLQVVKGVQLPNEVAPLSPPSGQQSRRVQMHLLKIHGRQVFFLVGVASALGPQRIAPVHDVAPVVLARVGHGQQDLAVR